MPGEKTAAVLDDPSRAYMAVPGGHGAMAATAGGSEMAQADHCAGSHSSLPAGHHDKIFCALCLPLVQTGTAMLAPPAPVLAIVLPPATLVPPARSDDAASRPPFTLPSPRAPPAA